MSIMTRAEHYREAMRLHEEANHVGHSDELRGLGVMMSAVFHATMAANSDLTRLSHRPPKSGEECLDCYCVGFHADGCEIKS